LLRKERNMEEKGGGEVSAGRGGVKGGEGKGGGGTPAEMQNEERE